MIFPSNQPFDIKNSIAGIQCGLILGSIPNQDPVGTTVRILLIEKGYRRGRNAIPLFVRNNFDVSVSIHAHTTIRRS